MTKYTCPCCGYKTLDSEHEQDICPICYWEDDIMQFLDPDFEDGSNEISLRQAQKNFIEFGASQREMLTYTRKPYNLDVKDKDWSPIA